MGQKELSAEMVHLIHEVPHLIPPSKQRLFILKFTGLTRGLYASYFNPRQVSKYV